LALLVLAYAAAKTAISKYEIAGEKRASARRAALSEQLTQAGASPLAIREALQKLGSKTSASGRESRRRSTVTAIGVLPSSDHDHLATLVKQFGITLHKGKGAPTIKTKKQTLRLFTDVLFGVDSPVPDELVDVLEVSNDESTQPVRGSAVEKLKIAVAFAQVA